MSTFTLYRFFDHSDELLYVGLTQNPGNRFKKHAGDKDWWSDVGRIELSQFNGLPELRAAERKAIETEKPRYNIRMNGNGAKPTTSQPPADGVTPDGLVGRSFHSWRPERDDDSDHATRRGDRVLEWQGRVVEQITDDMYLIETYSWWDGDVYERKLIAIDDMAMWTFYANNVEMQAALGCSERSGGYKCTAQAEYVTCLGNTVCFSCAGYYSSAREIIWNNGVPSLGEETTIPHRLSKEGMARL